MMDKITLTKDELIKFTTIAVNNIKDFMMNTDEFLNDNLPRQRSEFTKFVLKKRHKCLTRIDRVNNIVSMIDESESIYIHFNNDLNIEGVTKITPESNTTYKSLKDMFSGKEIYSMKYDRY